ncbi:conjugal transfer protein TrbE [Raoultella terrigena]|uniref:conjugal transfer protein TrbE n=1 Tax=Raoultella terrigena TaxID=577 RepID=UPI003891AFAD
MKRPTSVRRIKVIVSFAKHPGVDFCIRLLLTAVIIFPVVYFSWAAVTGTTASDYIASVIFILATGFIWFLLNLFLSVFKVPLKKTK